MAAKRPGPLEAFPRGTRKHMTSCFAKSFLELETAAHRDGLDFVIRPRLGHEYIKGPNGAFLSRSASFAGHCAIPLPA
jgi:hypothetical protein